MSQELSTGQSLHNGKFRIIAILGQGGFGITYLAEDVEVSHYVAIKEYFPKHFCRRLTGYTTIVVTHDDEKLIVEKGKNRFLKEARNLYKLKNQDIVKVYSAFQENNTAYYVMEYLEGDTLAQKVEKSGFLTLNQALNIMKPLCEAVAYIHSCNMTHYDLKPQNIIIRKSNHRPVVIDFGLSKQFDNQGYAYSKMLYAHSEGYSGKELYHESLIGNTFSPQTDVYSLGAILYFMLTGQRPPSSLQLSGGSLPQSPKIPSSVYKVIQKAMAENRTDRYPTVSQFHFALNKATSGGGSNNYNNQTCYGSSSPIMNDMNNEDYTSKAFWFPYIEKFKSGNWWVALFVIIVVFFTLIYRFAIAPGNKEREKFNAQEFVLDSGVLEDEIIEEIVDSKQQINSFASRKFSVISDPDHIYNANYNIQAENGVITVIGNEDGMSIQKKFTYNTSIDAENIIDQFEAKAYFIGAASVVPYIINDEGFYSETLMASALSFLKKSQNLLSKGNFQNSVAISSLESWSDRLNQIKKEYEKSDKMDKFLDEWEGELGEIEYGMGANPIKITGIKGL